MDVLKERAELGNFAIGFERFMRSCDFKSCENINFVLNYLSELSLKQGYELDAFLAGNEKWGIYSLYVCKEGATTLWEPIVLTEVQTKCCFGLFSRKKIFETSVPYNDNLRVRGSISSLYRGTLPSILPYFEVQFTPIGIMQAWLLYNAYYFMPMKWHACSWHRNYIFYVDRIALLFPAEESQLNGFISYLEKYRIDVRNKVLAFNAESLLPKVTINGDSATLECVYWNDWSGLVKEFIEVEKDGKSIKITNVITDVLVAFKTEIIF